MYVNVLGMLSALWHIRFCCVPCQHQDSDDDDDFLSIPLSTSLIADLNFSENFEITANRLSVL